MEQKSDKERDEQLKEWIQKRKNEVYSNQGKLKQVSDWGKKEL